MKDGESERDAGSGDWLLRPMLIADLEQVLAIEILSHPQPWTRRGFEDSIRVHHICRLVTAPSGAVCAYAVLAPVLDEVELLNFTVAPQCRRRGLGRALLSALLNQLQPHPAVVFLEVRESNRPAIGLYQTLGFKIIGRRKDYYGRPHRRLSSTPNSDSQMFVGEARSSLIAAREDALTMAMRYDSSELAGSVRTTAAPPSLALRSISIEPPY